jgi:putative ABC transport system permease protein
MTIVEAMAMGIISLLMSIVLGTVLTFVLIKVINLQSFNWTIFYHFSPKPYIIAGEISILSSLGSAIYPIWRLFRIYPQIQIREQ